MVRPATVLQAASCAIGVSYHRRPKRSPGSRLPPPGRDGTGAENRHPGARGWGESRSEWSRAAGSWGVGWTSDSTAWYSLRFLPRPPATWSLCRSPNASPTHPSPLCCRSHPGLFHRNCQALFTPGDPAPLDSPLCPDCPPHTLPSPRLDESHPGFRSPLPRDPREVP